MMTDIKEKLKYNKNMKKIKKLIRENATLIYKKQSSIV